MYILCVMKAVKKVPDSKQKNAGSFFAVDFLMSFLFSSVILIVLNRLRREHGILVTILQAAI